MLYEALQSKQAKKKCQLCTEHDDSTRRQPDEPSKLITQPVSYGVQHCSNKYHQLIFTQNCINCTDQYIELIIRMLNNLHKKFELTLTRCAKAYSSSGSVV